MYIHVNIHVHHNNVQTVLYIFITLMTALPQYIASTVSVLSLPGTPALALETPPQIINIITIFTSHIDIQHGHVYNVHVYAVVYVIRCIHTILYTGKIWRAFNLVNWSSKNLYNLVMY